jgi:hypothetical protein
MTGKTHRAGGMLCSIIGFEILRQKGLLLPDVNEGVQWLVMYPFTMWGSIASDLDHHWDSCPDKSYPSWFINKALHITAPIKKSLDKTLNESQKKHNPVYKVADFLNASHRSWQTHSDLTLIAMIYLLHLIIAGKFTSLGTLDISILTLILTGVCLGVVAHFILDVLTPEGVWITGLVILNRIVRLVNPRLKIPEKLHIVPHQKFFATGGKWEEFVNKVLKIATIVAIVWFLGSLLIPIVMKYIPYSITISN